MENAHYSCLVSRGVELNWSKHTGDLKASLHCLLSTNRFKLYSHIDHLKHRKHMLHIDIQELAIIMSILHPVSILWIWDALTSSNQLQTGVISVILHEPAKNISIPTAAWPHVWGSDTATAWPGAKTQCIIWRECSVSRQFRLKLAAITRPCVHISWLHRKELN